MHNIKEKPDPRICPREFCVHWLAKGDYFAAGVHENLASAYPCAVEVNSAGCGCTSFGVCVRLDSNVGTHDWYEPHEPNLEAAELPWFYFIPSPEMVDEGNKKKYILQSEAIWGKAHWL
jgi:hypothetical protein